MFPYCEQKMRNQGCMRNDNDTRDAAWIATRGGLTGAAKVGSIAGPSMPLTELFILSRTALMLC